MLAKRIIPCLDVKDGRVVKGVNFVGLRDAGDPVELAKFYSQEGADEIVFLDITATSDNRDTIADVVRRTCREVFVPVTVGGGIRTVDDFREILRAGADKISINSSAVKNPDLVNAAAEKYGSQCVVVAIDARANEQMPSGFEVYVPAAALRPERTQSRGRRRSMSAAQARSCSPRWTRTAPNPALTCRLPRRSRMLSASRSSPRAAAAASRIFPRCSSRPAVMPRSPRACSITAS